MGPPAGVVHEDQAKLEEQSTGELEERGVLKEPYIQEEQNCLCV